MTSQEHVDKLADAIEGIALVIAQMVRDEVSRQVQRQPPQGRVGRVQGDTRSDSLMTVEDVAALTSMEKDTLYKWRELTLKGVAARGPVSFKLHGCVVYKRSDVMAWIERQERDTTSASRSKL